jgi:hypothetical protein
MALSKKVNLQMGIVLEEMNPVIAVPPGSADVEPSLPFSGGADDGDRPADTQR